MKRFLALLLSFVIVFSVVAEIGLMAVAERTTGSIDWNNAMHFIIEHWHAVDDPNTADTGDDSGSNGSGNDHLERVEGYIVRVGDGEYQFFYDAEGKKPITTGDPNIGNINSENGTITLSVKPYTQSEGEEEKALESFIGFAIAAGHEAVEYDSGSIQITYNQYIHLVKAHAFYQHKAVMMAGSSDEKVFGSSDTAAGDAQKDTAYVYTYIEDGGIVTDAYGNPCYVSDGFPEGKSSDEIVATKLYSTTEGMHTDKTASAIGADGRRFNLDLEAWYVDETTVKVGMVLDASGSMAWTAGEPELITLSEEQITNLGIQVLDKKIFGNSMEWEKYFLDDDQLNAILIPHNTDNSRLSTSGYTYYIKDPRDSVQEYVPLGYWEGTKTNDQESQEKKPIGYYEFIEGEDQDTGAGERTWLWNGVSGNYAQIISQAYLEDNSVIFENPVPREGEKGWPQNDELKMSGENGFLLTGSNAGILLDAKPTSGNFTISFTIRQSEPDIAPDPETNPSSKLAEILYIGPIGSNVSSFSVSGGNVSSFSVSGGNVSGFSVSGGDVSGFSVFDGNVSGVSTSDSEGGYFRAIRGGEDSTRLVLNSVNDLASVSTVFGEKEQYTITLVFSDDGKTVTAYKNGAEVDNNSYTNERSILSDYNIIFNGIADEYDGADLYIDDIVVYDCVLSDDEVDKLVHGSPSDGIATAGSKVIGSIKDCFQDSGWYYVNHVNNWDKYNNTNLQSAKELWGVHKNLESFTDTFNGSVYRPDKTTATRFYVDGDGYLRCFFASSMKTDEHKHNTSYVYMKPDEDYTKVGALQRALGAFVTKLDEKAPGSQVSAVRFSTKNVIKEDDFSKLVLLNWTADPSESMKVLSLERDKGNGQTGAWGGTTRDDDGQYNYGLTGDTSTWRGLYAFQKQLAENDIDPLKEKKYLIIFTDGKDTDRGNDTIWNYDNNDNNGNNIKVEDVAEKLAGDLKRDGYTIFAVMLAGGAVDPDVEVSDGGVNDYESAQAFLLNLVGYEGMKRGEAVNYFFSTKDKNVAAEVDSVQKLIEIFSEKIIDEITEQLEDYTVQDYIDPRFDLVDAEGNVWHLNEGGNVSVVDKNGKEIRTYDLNNDQPDKNQPEITLSEDADVDESARTAKVFYDADNEMYYLKWKQWTPDALELNIPVVSQGVDRLNVWNARVTIQAKEDFIGGNAVLTNGHDEKMNYVYSEKDSIMERSSGTDDMLRGTNNEYPSKGFPRVVVNVHTPAPSNDEPDLIYMGEALSKTKEGIFCNAKAAAEKKDGENNTRTQWYWEYLIRYAENNDTTLAKLIAAGETNDDGSTTVTIPYFYLPSNDKTNPNQTGTDLHERDQLGTLVYEWKGDYNSGSVEDTITTDTSKKTATLSVTYIPLNVGEREKINNGDGDNQTSTSFLIQEGEYKWDSDYKPVEGSIVNRHEGAYSSVAEIVSGQIALQMVIKSDVLEYLQKHIPGQTLTYEANLVRNYGIAKEAVGTFTVRYTVPGVSADDNAATSDVVITPDKVIIEYTGGYASYVEEYGLPIGTYTLEPLETNSTKSPALFAFGKFGAVEVVTLKDEEHDKWFSRYGKQIGETGKKLTDFAAPDDDISVYLGTDENGTTYTNQRYALLQVPVEVNVGDLTVTKTVKAPEGEEIDAEAEFTFTIILSGEGAEDINGTYGDMFFEKGEATIYLKHEGSMTAKGLPAGMTYTVIESDYDGYEVKATGFSGTIPENDMATAAFTNTKNVTPTPGNPDTSPKPPTPGKPDTSLKPPTPPVTSTLDTPKSPAPSANPEISAERDNVPQTGDNRHPGLWLAMLVISLVVMGMSFRTLRRKKFLHDE